MYRKRRPEDVAHTASNTTLSSTPAQSVSPLLPSQRPTYGSVSSVDEPDNGGGSSSSSSSISNPQLSAKAKSSAGGGSSNDAGGVGSESAATTTAASVETYRPVSET